MSEAFPARGRLWQFTHPSKKEAAMKVSRVLLKISNLLVSAVVVLFLLAVGGCSA